MIGMDRNTGAAISGNDHLAQSIGDILTTPIGTRTMLRDYGSALFELIDRPLNGATKLLIFAATAMALRKWETRISITRVAFAPGANPGSGIVQITGTRTDGPAGNSLVDLTVPLRGAAASAS